MIDIPLNTIHRVLLGFFFHTVPERNSSVFWLHDFALRDGLGIRTWVDSGVATDSAPLCMLLSEMVGL